ncbi:hypothetical protein DFQ04_0420 [Algoriphagus boseongensis]|uniref:Uncharacterized protein n=1 Tax=Algoriphagus boseongensis TaxID=1442587 RepID=A0A4R6TAG7_9BACT|nr:hypothetical protein [Algoriphagus boseongensis]TDQ18615.1 hypothetical protein DFQ04_0420 [Algoriphagus boseongensis]
MEENNENPEKFFTIPLLRHLKNQLPKHYYKQFKGEWGIRHKKEPAPSRQLVYAVLNGNCDNDKIIEILIWVVEKRMELKKRLQLATDWQ